METIVNEALLQFIWKHSMFRPDGLCTAAGEPVTIIYPGQHNRDAGPDFLESRVKIGNTTLVGNIEMHINSSDWLKHGHQHDDNYKNLVLHVVYNNDVSDVAENIPVLELKTYIPSYIPAHYSGLMHATDKLPCASQHIEVRDITKEGWMSRLLAERWEQKLAEWNQLLEQTKDDWHDLLYWRMAANFGFKVNAAPFLMLARSIPLNVLGRHRDNLLQIEALLFGQAGMLNREFEEPYPIELQNEYNYLRHKYKLKPIAGHLWKFLRMRPANFPTVRVAQFAALIHKSVHLFSKIIEARSIKESVALLDVQASSYWDTHFLFDEPHLKPAPKSLGKDSMQNIIINTVAPIQFLYGRKQGMATEQEQAIQLLEDVPAEKNAITRLWEANEWKVKSAAQSQALIQLYNNYCSAKRCLECTIGLNIIRQAR